MFDNFRLKVFMALAREGSFTRAAGELKISQPAVSQNISELEKSVGAKLFERHRGEIVLTPVGQVLQVQARKILELQKSVSDLYTTLPPSTVLVAASDEIYSHILLPTLDTFRILHPDIAFEKALFDDADLKLSLVMSPDSPFDRNPDAVARIRASYSPIPEMGGYKATHEKTVYFDLLYLPSPSFRTTRLCRLLREMLVSL